jgi:hypothetical protein
MLKLYIGTKIVKAEPMDECSFLKTCKGQDVSNRETRLGYKVIYPDGYISWSPKEVFENAYREITKSEFSLLVD